MFKDMTVEGFVNKVASKSPAPGGGSVSALCGALASALASMVCNLTVGKKKYVDVQEEIQQSLSKIEPLSVQLLDYADKDTDAFNKVMDAYSMPKNNDEEKKVRRNAIQSSMKDAAVVPLEVARLSYTILGELGTIVKKGNRNAVTDALVATMLARTAVLGALYNVKINIMSIKDDEFVAKLQEEVEKLYSNTIDAETKILEETKL
jgi:formiminotetrahydrofolate cyclodeaminase